MGGRRCFHQMKACVLVLILVKSMAFTMYAKQGIADDQRQFPHQWRILQQQHPAVHYDRQEAANSHDDGLSRRKILQKLVLNAPFIGFVISLDAPLVAMADGGEHNESLSLTSRLFNADGSLKSDNTLGLTGRALSRTISIKFPALSSPGSRYESIDGSASTPGADVDGHHRVSYKLPLKWSADGYVDTSEGSNVKACDRITVLQVHLGKGSTESILQDASSTGVAKSLLLDVSRNSRLDQADLINARKRMSADGQYFDFDLAVAPAACAEDGKDNLRLGFCPYDSIVLLSAIIEDSALYVLQIECDKKEWKRASADLKLVRESFSVDTN